MTYGEYITRIVEQNEDFCILTDDVAETVTIGVSLDWWKKQSNSDEDCISRAELLKAVDTWDRFGCDADTKLVPVKDCYVPYIHYDDVVKAIKGMPSIQPKTGHWIVYEDCEGKTRRCVCDRCGHETGDYTWKNPNFCEECGADMREYTKER